MGLMWRLFAPRPLKKARRAMHPSWVIEDAVVRNVRGGRKRRRRSAPRGWQGTGEAYTPDGRHVRFACGHHHRTQAAALECVPRRQRQIERGDSLHLVTRVLDTPESRQHAAERAEREARRQQELAAKRQEAARQRAERREAARQKRAKRWEVARQARQARAGRRQAATQQTRQARAARTDTRREAAGQLAAERRARRVARPPLGWPGWGNISAGAAALTAVVLAGVAGKDAHSPLAVVAALLLVISVGVALVCVPVAVRRKFQARKRAKAGLPEP